MFDILANGNGIIAPKDLRMAMEKYGNLKPKK